MQSVFLTVIVAFLLCLVIGPMLIPMLHRLKFGQYIRDDGPQSHQKKAGTPTMGGIMIVVAMLAATLIFMNWNNNEGIFATLTALISMLGFGAVGFLDDFLKIKKKQSEGLKAREKIFWQLLLSGLLACYCYFSPSIGSTIVIPFVGARLDLGWFYIPFAMFLVIATVNSVNLIDGLDGLCGGVTLIVAVTISVIALFATAALPVPEIAQNMAVFAAAMAGGCLGFLRFNVFPARVIMGDTGAFALGGALIAVVLILGLEILLVFMGVMYVVTTLSDLIQFASYRWRNKKRVFKMAPLHHHFELSGVPETKIVSMYMIITAVGCLVALLAVAG